MGREVDALRGAVKGSFQKVAQTLSKENVFSNGCCAETGC
jgi:hypothetical protein